MRILMLLFKDIHLDARVQREARALAEVGYYVDIVCLKERNEPPPIIDQRVSIIRISLTTKRLKRKLNQTGSRSGIKYLKVVRFPIIKLLKDIFAQQEFTKRVYKIFLQRNYRFIHCHDLNTLPTGAYIKRKNNVKLIYDSHELFNEMAGKNKLERWIGYKIEQRLIKQIDHLIGVNIYCLEFMLKRYGNIPSTAISNTQDVELNKLQKPYKNYWRSTYKLKANDIILIYQGGLTPQRGIEECIESLNYLPRHYKLVILGEGLLLPKLKELVLELKLSDRVFFHEAVPPSEILILTAQADIGLVMYKNTCINNFLSTPNKVYEYFLSGIPTVASNHPGKKYIVEKLGTGVCVNEDALSISAGVKEVMINYINIVDNCLKIRSQYTWDVEKRKLIDIYTELLA